MAQFSIEVHLPTEPDITIVGETLSGPVEHPDAAQIEAMVRKAWADFRQKYRLTLNVEDERNYSELEQHMRDKESVAVVVHFEEQDELADDILSKREGWLLELISHSLMDALGVDRWHRGQRKTVVVSAK